MSLESVSAATVAAAALLAALGWLLKKTYNGTRLALKAVETIQRELSPNGGESTYDLVRKIKTRVDGHDLRLLSIEEKAQEAVMAAAAAVDEAKTSRAKLTSAHEQNVADLARTKDAVDQLSVSVQDMAEAGALKEVAYVRALNALGIPLTDIASEVLDRRIG